MWNRRDFLKSFGLGGLLLGTGLVSKSAFASKNKMQKICLLHTNDLHSRIEPFPKEDPQFGGLGGFARIHAMVEKIRKQEEQVLLLDAGDVFQGTPYFNFFQGEAEFKLMSKMKYDAGNIGNHEFDNGVKGISSKLKYLNFPLLNANYDFSGTDLEGKIPPYKIFQKGDLKIGVFGVGVDLEGLVEPQNRETIVYLDPVDVADKMVHILKNEQACDLVVCLSHLGYKSNIGEMCDIDFAKKSSGVDVIIGGHSHTLMETPDRLLNRDGEEVIINQVGWAGIALGRIDLYIDKKEKTKIASSKLLRVEASIA
ncbi:twin-arginine translocation signal domain-containing protein [Ancylomarina longa]|uniref:Twin-arginine translocation signal domain-containing protein n=2 Tax=Ancylomarina longa TaxID=2487017 RepID=A0A434AFE5_9BACT|nr:twin-arginine translocation signal domain-containing protein [Ancylomarina longa]